MQIAEFIQAENGSTHAVRETQKPRREARFLVHCGGKVVDRSDIASVSTPRGTATWYPLPHHEFVSEVMAHLQTGECVIHDEHHALSHEGARYFGTLTVSQGMLQAGTSPSSDYGFVVGLRNSHDKSFPASLVVGTRVFVCDNLCFSGEIRISRKHTRYAVRDLRALTARAVGRLGEQFADLGRRIDSYKAMVIGDAEAHDILIRAVDCHAITASQLPSVLQQWRKPKHEDFEPRNGWSLFNAVTEVHKEVNPHIVVSRGEALHGLFDQRAGFSKS